MARYALTPGYFLSPLRGEDVLARFVGSLTPVTVYHCDAVEYSLTMEQSAHSLLAAWETFYVIIGSSGAALTGLQFVVIALVAESPRRATTREIGAFGTPTTIHFCAVLLLSAILSAPWQGLSHVAIALGVCGLTGVIYGLVVIQRTRRQTTYRPVLEDWIWHTVLPLISYAMLTIAALALHRYARRILFLIAASTLLLLFIGIHNAWDTVTYIAIDQAESDAKRSRKQKRTSSP